MNFKFPHSYPFSGDSKMKTVVKKKYILQLKKVAVQIIFQTSGKQVRVLSKLVTLK